MNSHVHAPVEAPGVPLAGTVVAVASASVTVRLNHANPAGGAAVPAAGGVGLSSGSLVRIPGRDVASYGVVRRIWLEQADSDACVGMAEVELFAEAAVANGTAQWRLQRGVKRFPGFGDVVLPVTPDDLALLYGRPEEGAASVGQVEGADGCEAHLLVDRLLRGHVAVLGMTGAGKSCSVCVMLQAVLDACPQGRILILDPHNEYAEALGDQAVVISPDDLRVPYWLLNFEESVATLVSPDGPDREAETRILARAMVAARREFARAHGRTDRVTVDTPVPYYLKDLRKEISDGLGRLELPDGAGPYQRLIGRLDTLTADRRFRFMFPEGVVTDEGGAILARLLGFDREGSPVTIVDLSGTPGDIVDVVVSLVSRLLFEFGAWGGAAHRVPVLLVCEEAHRYLPADRMAPSGPSRRSLLRIAREGRKHGVSLCLVSQRPADLSEGVLSQCNTLVALRMTNLRDREFVASAAPDAALGLLDSLPALHNQDAVIVGEGVHLPTRLRFRDLDPGSRPGLRAGARADIPDGSPRDRSLVDAVLERWRKEA